MNKINLSLTWEGEGDTINEGRMVTSMDLFFSAKDSTLPVFVEISNVVNGYPGSRKFYLLVEQNCSTC